jgi:PadR family transcriptional regulator PadR
LRRGTVVVASLVALRRPDYGYALLQRLTDHGFPVDANTLYPLLRRLEDQGLLTSAWNTEESRPRKFYRTSDEGESMLSRLLDDLAAVQTSITGLIQGVDR